MKKIYALLGASLMAGSAMAALPSVDASKLPKPEQMSLSAEQVAQLNAEIAYSNLQDENGIKTNEFGRMSWTDTNGKVWELSAKYTGMWSSMFSTDWADDYAKVLITCTNYDATTKNGTRIQHLVFWPLQRAIGALSTDSAALMETVKKTYGDKFKADGLVPLEFMNTNYNFFTNMDMAFCCPQATTTAGSFYTRYTKNADGNLCWLILNSTTPQSSGTFYYQYVGYGSEWICTSGTYKYYGPTQYTTCYFSNYDSETQSINAALKGGMTQSTNGAAAYSYDLAYSGEAEFLGLGEGQKRSFQIGEVHLINTGVKDYDNWEFYDVDFGKLTRYYMLFCDPTLTFPASAFTTTSFEKKPYTKGSTYTVNWGAGALYSAENAEPTGVWKEFYVEYDKSYLSTNGPKAGSCVQYMLNMNQSYFSWSAEDGLYCYVNNDMTSFPCADLVPGDGKYFPFVMNGTTEGWGIQGVDFYNTTLKLNYKGNITYHNNPANYTQTTTLAAVGEAAVPAEWTTDGVAGVAAENNAAIEVVNGKVVIALDEAANVTVYNAAGMMVENIKAAAGKTTLELGNGLYIVKAGKKVAKVIL